MLSAFTCWCFAINTAIAIQNTTIGPLSLPRDMCGMSIGYDKTSNLIWLIGGRPWGTTVISFNLLRWNEATAIINHSEYTLSTSVVSIAQSYVQNAAFVYITFSSQLLAFDVSTAELNTINTNGSVSNINGVGCLASIGDWIIYTLRNKTYILTISAQTWKSSENPKMTEMRYSHSCIIEPDEGFLYVIGGRMALSVSALDSIEKLDVNDIKNINQYSFISLTDTLSNPKFFTRCILYKTDIYVIGGGDVFNRGAGDDIDVIDTKTDSVSLWGKLYEPLATTSPILIGSRVFVFGGVRVTKSVDYWQYFDVFSISIYI